jgi:hypothetical protein
MKNHLITALALTALVATSNACDSCKKDYVFGKPIVVGNGMAFSWARLDKTTKKPISIGVSLTESALKGLPEAKDLDPKMPMMEMVLELPKEIQGQPYDHITLDWNPVGHDPIPIYGKAHFDVHFYTISQAQRRKITLQGQDLAVSRKTPPSGYMAAGYILPPQVDVPMMGSHWINPTSPELSGGPFTSTFIYGSYNGQLAFVEPMIALSFLESKPNLEQKIPAPTRFARTGYYPTSYKINWNEARKEYSISLDNLAYHQAPNAKVVAKNPKSK